MYYKFHFQSVDVKSQHYWTYWCTDKFIGTNYMTLLIEYPEYIRCGLHLPSISWYTALNNTQSSWWNYASLFPIALLKWYCCVVLTGRYMSLNLWDFDELRWCNVLDVSLLTLSLVLHHYEWLVYTNDAITISYGNWFTVYRTNLNFFADQYMSSSRITYFLA